MGCNVSRFDRKNNNSTWNSFKIRCLKKTSDNFWKANQEIEYYFLDGTNITKQYIEQL